jgi:Arc/MetJ-type ribon-helix-helix transcriptional regulator
MYYMKMMTLRLPDELVEMLDTLPNKSDFIRSAIESAFDKNEEPEHQFVTKQQVIELIRLELTNKSTQINSPAIKGSEFVPSPPDPTTGYPCCTKSTPCKHWAWDGTESCWKNTLTGRARDA